jgi:hypothetical protein
MNEVSEMLKKAYEAVAAAEIPDQLHEAAFREAMRMLVPAVAPAAAVAPAVAPAASGRTSAPRAGGELPDVPENVMYERVVAQTGANREKVERLVHMDNGVPTISVPGVRLGKNNAEKTRRIAEILTIVRGFGLGENDTSLEVVRAEATRLKCYDSANFTAQLSKLDGYVITGGGQNRRIRAKAGGITGFPALVDLLIEEA